MMKCLEYRFCLTELEEEKTGDKCVQAAKNDESEGELSKIGNGKMNSKVSDTMNSDESEQDNGLCEEDSTNRSFNSDKDVKEGKQKDVDLKMLTRSMHSVLSDSNTQSRTPLGSKKIPAQNVENSFSASSTSTRSKKGAALNGSKQMIVTSMFAKSSSKRNSGKCKVPENGLHEKEQNREELTVVQDSLSRKTIETADTVLQDEKKVKLSGGDPEDE
ncbi:hypothetical protein B7P43_G01252, partial [Cryptotermes secundus]